MLEGMRETALYTGGEQLCAALAFEDADTGALPPLRSGDVSRGGGIAARTGVCEPERGTSFDELRRSGGLPEPGSRFTL
jgi:hypothetical protein